MKKMFTAVFTLFICFVFLQSLPFKFGNSLETQHIFGTLGEWSGLLWFGDIGGYLIGTFELIASVLLLVPLVSQWIRKPVYPVLLPLGGLLAMGIMTGAIFFHLFTPLGIEQPYFDPQTRAPIGDDGGLLFIMACFTWLFALGLVVMDWFGDGSELKKLLKRS